MNSDQVIDADLNRIIEQFRKENQDAGLITFQSVHPRWSYVTCGEDNLVENCVEKQVISKNAVAGFYYYKQARKFFESAESAIIKGNSVNEQFFISSTINEIILEDGKVGKYDIDASKYNSLYTPEKLKEYEDKLKGKEHKSNKNINIVIPAAGKGSRFSENGWKIPKPLIKLGENTMIKEVLNNLELEEAEYHVIMQKTHIKDYYDRLIGIENKKVRLKAIDRITQGTMCTVLEIKERINNKESVLIANSDQIVDINLEDFIRDSRDRCLDGSIMVFEEKTRSPKWSYALLGDDQLVKEVREKEPISDLATVGIYFFEKGIDLINSAIEMIINNERTNNEFYTCPVYNYMIGKGLRIGVYKIDRHKMHGIGTPEDLDKYLNYTNKVSMDKPLEK